MLPEEVRTLVIWKLLDDRSYTWDSFPACMPIYNARVRFTSGARIIDVDFCFSCSLIRVLEHGAVVGVAILLRGAIGFSALWPRNSRRSL